VRLLLATTNRGKVREIRQLLDGVRCGWPRRRMAERHAPEETGRTFEENARAKARIRAATGELTVAEDSGLESTRSAARPEFSRPDGGEDTTYPEKFALIYGAARDGRQHGAICLCARARQGWTRPLRNTGTVEGRIAPRRKGGGFGHDPIFFIPRSSGRSAR
jgi:XTP/dITP diphosphohydrolase